MNKAYLKTLLACLCIILGCFFCLFSFYTFKPSEPSYILSLTLSLSLCLVGTISGVFSYKQSQIINSLKQNKLSYIAKWTYSPQNYRLIELQMEESHSINISLVFLVGILGLLIILGLTFNSSPIPLYFSVILILLLLTCCTTSFITIHNYYYKQLKKPLETIISSQYILYNGELFSVQKGLYALIDVRIIFKTQYYIQFVYGAPGTPYGPFQTLTIPIPEGELAVAYMIKEHYIELIKNE